MKKILIKIFLLLIFLLPFSSFADEIKFWRVGNIVVVEHILNDGTRIIHAKSFVSNEKETQKFTSSFPSIYSPYHARNPLDYKKSRYCNLEIMKIVESVENDHSNGSYALDQLRKFSWDDKDLAPGIEIAGHDIFSYICDKEGSLGPMLDWISYAAGQPNLSALTGELYLLENYLKDVASENEKEEGIKFIESLESLEWESEDAKSSTLWCIEDMIQRIRHTMENVP